LTNTTSTGTQLSDEMIKQVWDKAQTIPGLSEHIWRVDSHGKWILWTNYNNRNSAYGWEIAFINPTANTDSLDKLQALHWESIS
jgi:hypothetical protein